MEVEILCKQSGVQSRYEYLFDWSLEIGNFFLLEFKVDRNIYLIGVWK